MESYFILCIALSMSPVLSSEEYIAETPEMSSPMGHKPNMLTIFDHQNNTTSLDEPTVASALEKNHLENVTNTAISVSTENSETTTIPTRSIPLPSFEEKNLDKAMIAEHLMNPQKCNASSTPELEDLIFDVRHYISFCNTTVLLPYAWTCPEEAKQLCPMFYKAFFYTFSYDCYISISARNKSIENSEAYIMNATELLKNVDMSSQLRCIYEFSIQNVMKLLSIIKTFSILVYEDKKYSYALLDLKKHTKEQPLRSLSANEVVKLESNVKEVARKTDVLDEISLKAVTLVDESGFSNIFATGAIYNSIDSARTEYNENREVLSQLEKLYRSYYLGITVFPIISWTLLTIGVFSNVSLLVVFALFKEARCQNNILLINLAIVDCLTLTSNLEINSSLQHSFWVSDYVLCRWVKPMFYMFYVIGIYTVTLLCYQRFRVVSMTSVGGKDRVGCIPRTLIETLGVWALGIMYTVLKQILLQPTGDAFCVVPVASYEVGVAIQWLESSVDCILPIFLSIIWCILTARRLKQRMPGESVGHGTHMKDRVLASRAMIGLVVLMIVTYSPYYIIGTIVKTLHSKKLSEDKVMEDIYERIIKLIAFSNCCLNPIVLYFMSSKFRRLYHRILCYWKKASDTSTGT